MNTTLETPYLGRSDGGKFGWRKPSRRTEAAERQTARDARCTAEQIAELDARLGVGIGATKERARLSAE